MISFRSSSCIFISFIPINFYISSPLFRTPGYSHEIGKSLGHIHGNPTNVTKALYLKFSLIISNSLYTSIKVYSIIFFKVYSIY